MKDRIKRKVSSLCNQYKTTDPYDLAYKLGIFLLKQDLGSSLDGFYFVESGRRFIGINAALPDYKQRYTLCHELGHAVMHPEHNTLWMKKNTLYAGSKYEKEADLFAVSLLAQDMDELPDTLGAFASNVGMDAKMIMKLFE